MRRFLAAAIAAAFCLALSASPAEARKRVSQAPACTVTDRNPCSFFSGPWAAPSFTIAAAARVTRYAGPDGRPRRWCGWWMRQRKGHADRSLNLAVNWFHKFPRTVCSAGAVVVWRHHVGEIVSMSTGSMATVISGNDGGAVRTRLRSIGGALGCVRA